MINKPGKLRYLPTPIRAWLIQFMFRLGWRPIYPVIPEDMVCVIVPFIVTKQNVMDTHWKKILLPQMLENVADTIEFRLDEEESRG